jgi:hypothetical protein
MENHIMPAVAWARKPVEKAPAQAWGWRTPLSLGGTGRYARVRRVYGCISCENYLWLYACAAAIH